MLVDLAASTPTLKRMATSSTEMSVITIRHGITFQNDRFDNFKLHVINTAICETVIAVNLSIYVKCQ